jgi:hypothetical protein
MHQYLRNQINFIKFCMKYVLIIYLFKLVDIIFSLRMSLKLVKFDLEQLNPKWTIIITEGAVMKGKNALISNRWYGGRPCLPIYTHQAKHVLYTYLQ